MCRYLVKILGQRSRGQATTHAIPPKSVNFKSMAGANRDYRGINQSH